MNKEVIGSTKNGSDIIAYTITNATSGMKAVVLNVGCALKELYVKDNSGKLTDVVLGFENASDYEDNGPGFGANVLPNCNRIGEARYTINGVTYELEKNDGNNNLHSGSNAMHHKVWSLVSHTENAISQTYTMSNLECGFPGPLTVTMTYTLGDDGTIRLDYSASADVDTVFNPTNHTYFNLSGHNAGSTLDNMMWIDADTITVADTTCIPRGEICNVAGTAFDFTTEKQVGKDILDPSTEALIRRNGYDTNFVLNKPELDHKSASLYDPKNGMRMDTYTNLPGLQIYVGNFLGAADLGKGNNPHKPYDGICFEAQFAPNSINVPSFASPLIKAGETKTYSTIYKFY